jgi:hypothetical protein
MKTFDFYKDEKKTIWLRLKFSIEAESYEQALEKINQIEGDPRQSYDDDDDWEYLYETLEDMDPEDNGGESTCEIQSEDEKELVYTNKPKTN